MLEGESVENVFVDGTEHFRITAAPGVVSSIEGKICQSKGRK
jgi:hypothetical protein